MIGTYYSLSPPQYSVNRPGGVLVTIAIHTLLLVALERMNMQSEQRGDQYHQEKKSTARHLAHGMYSLLDQNIFIHSDLTEQQNTIGTIHGWLSCSSINPAGWLLGLSNPNHNDERHSIHLNWLFTSFCLSTSSVDLHMASYFTPLRKRKICQGTVQRWSHTT